MTPDAQTSGDHVVGRVDELSRLEAFLDGLVDGPAAFVLEGEPGMGKTTLWDRGVAAASERGWRVMAVRAAESETTLSFAGLADLFDGARDLFASLPAPQLAALEVALLRAEPEGPPPDPRAVYVAALTVLRAASADDPVLIALDDVQWLDGSTTAALAFALRRLEDARIGWLITVRDSGSISPLGIARSLPEERVTRISVGALSLGELAELVRVRLDASFPRPVLTSLRETSGGNPFFALEIARATIRGDERATGLALPIPRNLRDDLVRERVGSLPSIAQEMLRYAAACSRPTVDVLEAALERAPLEPMVTDAVDAGIVVRDGDVIRFVHPLYRSAIYADSSREHRHRIHRRLSAVVNDGEERARHLALAADGTDDAAASSLERAAQEARGRGSTAAAAELCELAERLTPPDRVGDVLRIRSAAAQDLLLAGDHERAVGLFASVAAGAPLGAERAAAQLHLGRALVVVGDERRAADVLTQALGEEGVPSPILSSIHAWRSYAGASLGDLRGALADAEEALRLVRSDDDPGLTAGALTALVTTRVWLGEGLDEALMTEAIALETSSAPRPIAPHPSLRLASLPTRTGAIDQGRSMCEALLLEATRSGDVEATGRLHAELGWAEFLAGDWEASFDHLVQAVDLSPSDASALGALALLEAHLGAVEAARSHAAEGLQASERSGSAQAEILALSAMGALELAMGNAPRAREHLERAWQRHRDAGFGEPAMFPFVADHAVVQVELGGGDATAVVEWLEERGRALDRPWALAAAARARALMWAAGGDLPAALDALDHALGEHARVAMPFELARTLLVLGSVRRRAKQKRPARDALEEAIRIFERLGARPWVEQARGQLARIGGRRAAAGQLTPAEHRVAKLAVAGRTNREIAETLFVSVRTVEGTLSHVYAKLGVRSRTELAVFFEEQDESPPPDGPDANAP